MKKTIALLLLATVTTQSHGMDYTNYGIRNHHEKHLYYGEDMEHGEYISTVWFYCTTKRKTDPHCAIYNEFLMHLAKDDKQLNDEISDINHDIKTLSKPEIDTNNGTNFINKALKQDKLKTLEIIKQKNNVSNNLFASLPNFPNDEITQKKMTETIDAGLS